MIDSPIISNTSTWEILSSRISEAWKGSPDKQLKEVPLPRSNLGEKTSNLLKLSGRISCLMVCTLDSEWCSSGRRSGRGHRIVILAKTLYSPSVSLHPVNQMSDSEFSCWGNPAMDYMYQPIQGEEEILPVTQCDGKWENNLWTPIYVQSVNKVRYLHPWTPSISVYAKQYLSPFFFFVFFLFHKLK